MQSYGELIEHWHGSQLHRSTLISPIKVLYSPHLLHLVQIKLRIAHFMAHNVPQVAAE